MADPARGPTGPDHGDALGLEQSAHGGHRGEPLPLPAGGAHALGVADVEADPDDTLLRGPHPLDEAGVPEDVEHAQVLSHRLGPEAGDPRRPAQLRQVLEQQGADPPTLEVVTDHEGDLSLPRGGDDEVADPHHGPGVERAEVQVGGGVAGGQPVQLRIGHLAAGGEVAETEALRREVAEEETEDGDVLGPEGADGDRRAVDEGGIGAPVERDRGWAGGFCGHRPSLRKIAAECRGPMVTETRGHAPARGPGPPGGKPRFEGPPLDPPLHAGSPPLPPSAAQRRTSDHRGPPSTPGHPLRSWTGHATAESGEADSASLPAATGSAGESPHHRRLESQGARTGRNGQALGMTGSSGPTLRASAWPAPRGQGIMSPLS